MRVETDLWQQKGDDWQQAFIATNLLVIGYNAWVGYLAGERGAVVCSLKTPHLGIAGESFPSHYVPRSRMVPFLNAWLANPEMPMLYDRHLNAHLLEAVDGYNPQTDAILLLESGGRATLFYLRNMAIAPPQSYKTICMGWDEFHLSHSDLSQMSLHQFNLTP
ncbi:hypothetical protein [Oxynema aestuarii]|uniref:Uncharacterized protein n=1 Tax=Oxynema aestuarii AP17 TaxID=2064643 RepID=A0A6H1TVM2_9CYAN|nr:hypothetical protein [Oxynema aestuarii]QIZ70658.1 hypothetical protein HCG48_08765 [Oxynema aestuarii AP17]RMH76223.1 MAG: hypothetical protein D6680_09090 [Cyanobacteria bacterium J007]